MASDQLKKKLVEAEAQVKIAQNKHGVIKIVEEEVATETLHKGIPYKPPSEVESFLLDCYVYFSLHSCCFATAGVAIAESYLISGDCDCA